MNLVANGDFESSRDFWITDGGWQVIPFALDQSDFPVIQPYNGALFASTNCAIAACPLRQDLPTTPGQTYTLSFAYNPGWDSEMDLPGGLVVNFADTQVFWNGQLVADLAGAQGHEADGGWATYTITGLRAAASSTPLQFSGYQELSFTGLDAISVTAAPEPASWALMLAGFAALAFAGHARRNAASATSRMRVI